MSKQIKLIGVINLKHNHKFCHFTVIYNVTENSGFFSSTPMEKTFIREASGNMLDNLAESIIMNFNDNGKYISDELGHGLSDVIERKIRLQISESNTDCLNTTKTQKISFKEKMEEMMKEAKKQQNETK